MQDPSAFFDHFRIRTFTDANGKEYLGRDISTRVAVFEEIKKSNAGLVNYLVRDGQRADQVAWAYYGDDRLAWVIYLVNDIIDPWHDWPLGSQDLEDHIISKYGSLNAAQEKIVKWRTNWSTNESTISEAAYNALTEVRKDYWQPVYGYNNIILYYERKKFDKFLNSNKIIRLNISNPSNYNFTVGHLIKNASDSSINAEIAYIGTNFLLLKNVFGVWTTGSIYNSTVEEDTGASYTSSTTIKDNLAGVSDYFEFVTAYQEEIDNNEEKKHIKLLEKNFLSIVTDNLRDIVS